MPVRRLELEHPTGATVGAPHGTAAERGARKSERASERTPEPSTESERASERERGEGERARGPLCECGRVRVVCVT